MKALILILAGMFAVAPFLSGQERVPRGLRKPAPAAVAATPAAPPAAIILEGNKAFRNGELLQVVEQQEGSVQSEGPTAATGDDAAYFLEMYYQRHGYADAVVNYEIRGSSIVLTIVEGDLVRLGKIIFEGNESFPAKELESYFLAKTKERTGLWGKKAFVKEDLEDGANQIRLFYLSKGYAEVAVAEPVFSPVDGGKKMDVSLSIQEGPLYSFRVVRMEGDLVFPEEELLAALEELKEGPYTSESREQVERKLKNFYRQKGYYEPEVKVAGGLENADAQHVVPFVVSLHPGRAYTFGEVRVTGVRYLEAGFVEKRFEGMQGKSYSPQRIKSQYETMVRTGLFDDLKIYPKPQPDGTLDLDVAVSEAKPREFSFSLGFETYDGPLGSVDYINRSIFDTGRIFHAGLEASMRGYKGDVSFTDPWLFDSAFNLTAKIFAEYKDYDVYTIEKVGARLELGRKFGDLQTAAFAQALHASVSDYSIQPYNLGPPKYEVASAGLAATYDRRDSKVIPHSGYILSGSVEEAPEILQVSFTRLVLKGGYYIPWGKSTFMLLGQGGVIYPQGDGDLPIDEKFFNGGANTVRSFNERDMGPQDPNGEHVGGEAYTAFTAEWDFPLVGDLYGAGFVDAGNLMRYAEDFGLSNMRYGIGLGLRYYLPIGPIRIDAALNPDPEEGETSGAVHFGFGFTF